MKFVFPIPCCVHIWRHDSCPLTQQLCLSPKFNVRCFIILFRFVCLWMVFVCLAFLVGPTGVTVYFTVLHGCLCDAFSSCPSELFCLCFLFSSFKRPMYSVLTTMDIITFVWISFSSHTAFANKCKANIKILPTKS